VASARKTLDDMIASVEKSLERVEGLIAGGEG
jgi:hypothetical protein